MMSIQTPLRFGAVTSFNSLYSNMDRDPSEAHYETYQAYKKIKSKGITDAFIDITVGNAQSLVANGEQGLLLASVIYAARKLKNVPQDKISEFIGRQASEILKLPDKKPISLLNISCLSQLYKANGEGIGLLDFIAQGM